MIVWKNFKRFKLALAALLSVSVLAGCVTEAPYTAPSGKIWVKVCKEKWTAGIKQQEGEAGEIGLGGEISCEWQLIDEPATQTNNSLLNFNSNWFLQWQFLQDLLNGPSPWVIPSTSMTKTSSGGSGLSIKLSGTNIAVSKSQGAAKVTLYRDGAISQIISSPYTVNQSELLLTDPNLQYRILSTIELAKSYRVAIDIEHVLVTILDAAPGKVVTATAAISDGSRTLKAASASIVTRGMVCEYRCIER